MNTRQYVTNYLRQIIDEPWMTLKEQKPEEGEKVVGFYYSCPTPKILRVQREVDSEEYEAFNNDSGEDMGEPDFWIPMPIKEEHQQ